MRVLRPFDRWVAGQELPSSAVKKYEDGGNLPDLIRNGFLSADEPRKVKELTLDDYSVAELKQMAKVAGIPGYSRMKKAELIKELQ